MSKELHKNILDEIHDTYIRKNADYGNSFGEQYQEYGLLSALIRLDDKMRRLKQLNKQEALVKDESIRDTVLDLANYAIMTVMELDKKVHYEIGQKVVYKGDEYTCVGQDSSEPI